MRREASRRQGRLVDRRGRREAATSALDKAPRASDQPPFKHALQARPWHTCCWAVGRSEAADPRMAE
eukprot:scaffold281073_cov27-Tisochrysis_lutea.AAC.1